jgi:hypothetical protein
MGNTLFYYGPDLRPVLNEILTLPGWGAESPALVLCLDDAEPAATSIAHVEADAFSPIRWPVALQVARTLDEAFLCPESLARPTDHSITVHFIPLVEMEVMVKYSAGGSEFATVPKLTLAEAPCSIVLEELEADTDYLYHLEYRLAGSGEAFQVGPVHRFHTQRSRGSGFVFTTEADSHMWEIWQVAPWSPEDLEVYQITQANVGADAPDFHLNLGDFSMSAYSPTRENAFDRYAAQRRFLHPTTASVPFYLVLGNHEGELGWRRVEGDSIPVRAEAARLAHVPNPIPDGFYDGCPDSAASGGPYRESYYSWEWGDALFVVLDPFWNTLQRPVHMQPPDSNGGWRWTLGHDQYEWLYRVLHESDSRWKIVLLHHLLGGVENLTGFYGRGGIEVVKWQVAHRATYEWGGENRQGQDVFAQFRPGWNHGPIHDLLKDAGVELVIHGHDHFCALQQWDGMTYVLCPQPSDRFYSYGTIDSGGYQNGTLLPNSGHLRFQVSPEDIVVQYVRAFRPGDGENGAIVLDYSLTSGDLAAGPAVAVAPTLRVLPNPAPVGGAAYVEFAPAVPTATTLHIFDVAGRLRATFAPAGDGGRPVSRWNLREARLPGGVYWCRVQAHGAEHAERLVLVP